ncbi:MAG: aspartic peptidase domain-containing protein [Podila humilis]|nr:MAG: aspartic peptidase domain-containing protein [Podila humilis]
MRISLVAGLVSLAIISQAAILRIPIKSRDAPSTLHASLQKRMDVDGDGQLQFGAYPRRNNDPPGHASRTVRPGVGLPTETVYGSWMEGTIHLGTPPQEFTIRFSTIGSNTYVISKSCDTWGCPFQPRYDATKSSTYKENGTYFDLYGVIHGRISNDVLRIGYREGKDSGDDDSNILVIPDQDFGEATFDLTTWMGLGSGLFSLGFSSDNDDEEAVTGVPPVLNWARQQKSKEDALVGVYLSPDMMRPGQITFGGLDRAHYIGELHWNALAKKGAWSTHVNRIVALGRGSGVERSVSLTETPILFSTSTYLLASLTEEQARLVNEELLGGAEVQDDPKTRGYYELPCDSFDKLPTLSFVIGSESYAFKASDYVRVYDKKGVNTCGSLIVGSAEDQHFGLAFMRKFYVGLDIGQSRIGLAPSKMVV